MFKYQGIWLPDGEKHLTGMLDRGPFFNGIGTYQYHKYKAVMAVTPERNRVIDVGAHVGLWSMHFVKEFNYTEAFEPIKVHQDCFLRNVVSLGRPFPKGFTLHPQACGSGEHGQVQMHIDPNSSGDTYPVTTTKEENAPWVELVKIDDFNFEDVNLIKLDCEGYELFALRGAEETIKQSKPTVIVEQKPGKAQKYGLEETQAVTYLEGLGMRLVKVISGDFIMVW